MRKAFVAARLIKRVENQVCGGGEGGSRGGVGLKSANERDEAGDEACVSEVDASVPNKALISRPHGSTRSAPTPKMESPICT